MIYTVTVEALNLYRDMIFRPYCPVLPKPFAMHHKLVRDLKSKPCNDVHWLPRAHALQRHLKHWRHLYSIKKRGSIRRRKVSVSWKSAVDRKFGLGIWNLTVENHVWPRGASVFISSKHVPYWFMLDCTAVSEVKFDAFIGRVVSAYLYITIRRRVFNNFACV